MKALFDTNILIAFLRGVPEARGVLREHADKAISIITWMEVLAGASPRNDAASRTFLTMFELVHLDEAVAERAVDLRRRLRIKLPDAIIWATAECHSMVIVTRNTKDFPATNPGVIVPYILR